MRTSEHRAPQWVGVAVAVVGLAGIGVAQAIPNRHSIEDNLTQRSTAALESAGVSGVQVRFVGRDGELVVPSASDVDRARSIVADVEGVRVVSARGPAVQPATKNPAVTITVDGSRVVVTGAVPSVAARSALTSAVGAQDGQLTVDAGVTDAGLARLPAVVSALGSNGKGVTIELREGRITLTGRVDSAAVRDAAVAAAGPVVGGDAFVTNRLEVVAPPEVVQRALTDLPQITFENDSATLTPAGQAAVANAADILRANPSAKIRIEGHTDDNGSPESNLVLSQARAQTVLNALVALGIAAERLTAAGFGESRPKAPDTSAEARAINRRVEFVVS